ncbi:MULTISPECIES: alpha/beta hydrolase [Streptomyces]|uniref:Alpha/beta hydrolase n=2 Tax=Streptomyces TaxID=1883 RepID=A0ABV9JB74_9ACTN
MDILDLSDEELSQGGAFDIEERTVPGPQGAPDISLLICRPAASTGGRPVIYHTHGGGMILGNNRFAVAMALDWARELDAVVVSVEYRLVPEHPYPAPVEDVYAGLLLTAEYAKEIGGDPARIVIEGVSSGGGLRAALALLTRDRQGPRPIGQLLLCPMLDDRNDTPSAHQMAGLGIWDRTSNETGGPRCWATGAAARTCPRMRPLPAPRTWPGCPRLPRRRLRGDLPGRDRRLRLRDWQAGGVAELHVWPGGFHGYEGFAPQATLSEARVAARLAWLRRLLGE